ncbi:MAG TPA: LuxR C-terminal-related transcriptional regulator [Anaerolineales bacterium]
MADDDAGHWVEPISSREREILSLISNGLSNREIAQRLHLSIETVKWYNKQLFSKLGVNSRSKALSRAAELKLLAVQPASLPGDLHPADHNLPSPLTSFVGRRKEIGEIKELLRSFRLVVITGPGGSGKTRMALQVAGELAGSYRDGIRLVELAPLQQSSLVANAIAQALNLTLTSEAQVAETLIRYLARKHLLLVLDNFEHLLEAAPLASEILTAAPQVTILATSRERLDLYGEQEYQLHPLELPDLRQKEPAQQLLKYDAVNLFFQRLGAFPAKKAYKESELIAAVQICIRLDGLPLAIELAASHAKILPLPVLAGRLQENLSALPGGPRDAVSRQRTLHTTIQWSYDLLKTDEKLLFARLSVFRGGGSLEAVERVCGHGMTQTSLDVLTSLVYKNMIFMQEETGDELRFNLLEIMREFAQECLAASGEVEQIRHNHAAYLAQLGDVATDEIRGPDQVYWYNRLRAESDNLRAAMTWSFQSQEPEFGMRLVADLRDYWYYTGSFLEGLQWAELAIERSAIAQPKLLAGILSCAGAMAFSLNDLTRGREFHRRSLALYREIKDEQKEAWSLTFLGSSYLKNPDEFQEGMALVQSGLELFRKVGDGMGIAQASNLMGEFTRSQKDYSSARLYYEEGLSVAREIGDQVRIAMLDQNLGFIAYHQKEYLKAQRLIRESIQIMQQVKSDYGLGILIACLAGPENALGAPKRAARLLGFSSALLQSIGVSHQLTDQPEINHFTEDARRLLGVEAFEAACQSGQSMTLQQAVAYALSDTE